MERSVSSDQLSVMQTLENTDHRESVESNPPGEIDLGEQVIVKADPEDFQEQEENQFVNSFAENHQGEETGGHRGIVIRNDLLNLEASHQNQGKVTRLLILIDTFYLCQSLC